MPFFPDLNKTNKVKMGTPTPIDVECARKLIKTVQEKRKVMKKINENTWAKAFYNLRIADKYPQERIVPVLDWYIEHFGEEFVPEAFSATGFREKFLAIESAKQRDVGEELIISPLATKIVKRLEGKHWPKGSKADLPVTVEMSLRNYQAFLEQVKNFSIRVVMKDPDLKVDEKTATKLFRFCEKFVRPRLAEGGHFIEQWLLDVNESVADWEGWSGDLKKKAFKVTAKRFKQMGRGWAQEYCGDESRWDLLVEHLA